MVLNLMFIASSLHSPSPCTLFSSHKLCWSSFKTISKQSHAFLHRNPSLQRHLSLGSKRVLPSVCFFNTEDKSDSKESGWPILRRWEVPWEWQTVSLTSLACGFGFVLAGLTEAIALPYLGIKPDVLSLDDKAEILLLDQSITTAVVLGIIYSVANTFQPLPEDFFKYDLREPFNLQKGWLLWAGVGLAGAILAISLTGVAVSFFNGETPQRETDALVRLLPLIGSSNLSTACLVGITGVLAPLLEETVFRGFFMTSLTKWDCFGVFICSNSQPSHSHHYPFFLEFRSYITSYFSAASRVRYQRIVAGNLMENFILCMDVEHHVQYIIQIHFVVYLCSFPCCKT
ncbi:hypothetical protein AAZV13_18G099300 [Glycine max]